MLLTFAQSYIQNPAIASGSSPIALTNAVGTAATQSQAVYTWFFVANS